LRAPTRIVGLATLSLCLLVLLAFPATSGADRVGQLRAARAALAAREQAALLQLYALNTSLDRARGQLAGVESALASAQRDRATALDQLRVARRTLAVAQRRLGEQLRALYEHGNPSVLAVIFGATSLDELITGLDNLSRAATSTSTVIAQTKHARSTVAHVLGSLNHRAARLARLRALAAARTSELAGAQAERSAYIARLRTQQQLTTQRIADLEARARTAEAASTIATVKAKAVQSLSALGSTGKKPEQPGPAPPPAPATPPATAPSPPPPAPAAPAPIQPASGSGKQLTVVATAYSLHGGTASGLPTGPGVVAVDPTVIPLGTRMYIPGYGPGIAADTGTAIKGLRIDLWFPKLSQAESWGRRTVTITLR
jgi:3D (Asp-Asp-Asp) domain-containing protein/peptidoglycan hydrolase CwlO-like protein